MQKPHVFIVDDELFILDSLRIYFESNEFRVSTASGGLEARETFARHASNIDVVILDLLMPGVHGLELLQEFKRREPSVQIVIATGCGSMGSAIEALRLGAFDFITKPILDFDNDLMKSVQKALDLRQRMRLLADEAPQAPPRAAVIEVEQGHWLRVMADLDAFAALGPDADATEETSQSAWRLLRDGFRADRAVLVERHEDAWWMVLSWGPGTLTSGEPLTDSAVMTALRRLPDDASGPSDPLDSPPAAPGRILPVRIDGPDGGPDRLLVLVYDREIAHPDADPTRGPLALLATVLGRVLRHFPASAPRAPGTERDEAVRSGV